MQVGFTGSQDPFYCPLQIEWGWQPPGPWHSQPAVTHSVPWTAAPQLNVQVPASPLGCMAPNPGHLRDIQLGWSNTSWLFPCVYTPLPRLQSKRLGANSYNTNQMKASPLIQGCFVLQESLYRPSPHCSARAATQLLPECLLPLQASHRGGKSHSA